jgi:hypothetical protein
MAVIDHPEPRQATMPFLETTNRITAIETERSVFNRPVFFKEDAGIPHSVRSAHLACVLEIELGLSRQQAACAMRGIKDVCGLRSSRHIAIHDSMLHPTDTAMVRAV